MRSEAGYRNQVASAVAAMQQVVRFVPKVGRQLATLLSVVWQVHVTYFDLDDSHVSA